ncbi:hypothetical protein MP228_006850 [Amoeboaphelidium protococcarum]|nr:hypothetical protein MP228_006850 [Amoeboaphelidium protococcarum]
MTLQQPNGGIVESQPSSPGITHDLASLPDLNGDHEIGLLKVKNGSAYQGISFGATKSVSGELVFQTGMVGYVESLTDPSYCGQILVLTYPLIGNYGVPSWQDVDKALNDLPRYFESHKIHVAGLIVASYTEEYSHYLAKSSLAAWLKKEGVPALWGIDTRVLTQMIRDNGSMLGSIVFGDSSPVLFGQEFFANDFVSLPFEDPNELDLVAKVSCKEPKLYAAPNDSAVVGSSGRPLRILALDVGMKYNQIRCFNKYGVDVLVVPHDYDIVAKQAEYDGLFLSNGPGDPKQCQKVINKLSQLIKSQTKPIFGICLGHQLIALAAGAQTSKMKFGNRGHNIPCTDLLTGRCYITSQNHGYAVDASTLPDGWKEYFVNANDGSNEGIYHQSLPYFSVQFHPESNAGPKDTEFLFQKYIDVVRSCSVSGKLAQFPFPSSAEVVKPNRVNVKKVLILGSGGLSIGQAGEFDYSGSQAIKALKEEGIYTVLINPNIATIQTSKGLADKVYFLPVTPDFVRKVIQHEKPDGIYVSFGGQTALNCGIKMKDEFEQLGVKVLGTPIETVIMTEDRELFACKMAEIGEKCAESASAQTVKEALDAARKIGYPVIARAAFALGGLGSGFAQNEKELTELCNKAFAVSPQVLVEKSMKGWKEIEYEVVRDCNDNCITVCNMENFDPLGIHTGDSIVVCPSQTLSDEDYNMLRSTAVNVIRHLGVVGECNIQYALNPDTKQYCIIEVNARLSRSSALASKATGYPLAFVAAKLGLNIPLNELKNNVTKVTCACFEPSLDYVVVKMPRWDLKKFTRVSTKVGSAMKSVGEVMSIGRSFEETIQKALRCIDGQFLGFSDNQIVPDCEIEDELKHPSDKRVFAIARAFHLGKFTVDQVWQLTSIDKWFLNKLYGIVQLDKRIREFKSSAIPVPVLKYAKQIGFADKQIAQLVASSEMAVRKYRVENGILPFVKQIDTVAAESPAFTNYLYMTYNASSHDVQFNDSGVIVLGSGVYRIGSSVEFDWCAVRTIRTLRENGQKTVMINFNPETVSTDYDEADRLYFENITLEKVLDIYQLEQSTGVVVSMGGQTSNNIALQLHRENVKVLGTSPEQIDGAENRYKFSRMCDSIEVDQPQWKELSNLNDAQMFCDKVGFPVLVRPSYVLSGAAMNVVYSAEDLESYLKQAVAVSQEHPVVISKFIEDAKEIEMDAVAKDGVVIHQVISEHVENAGVHSGDATLILPPQDLEKITVRKIEEATQKIATALNVTGPFNIQFIAKDNQIKVIECNVRASRSFPFVSKVLGVDMIELATKIMLGLPYDDVFKSRRDGRNFVCVKVPQFSFGRLSGSDPVLGVEMSSTGEVACFGRDKYEAYLKALLSTGFKMPKKNILLSIGSYKEKQEFLPSVFKLMKMGFVIYATAGTADFISEHGIPVKMLESYEDHPQSQGKPEYSLHEHLSNNLIDLYINLPSRNKYRRPASYMSKGYISRRLAVDMSIPLITNVKCAKLFVEALTRQFPLDVTHLDCQSSHQTVKLPGFIDVGCYLSDVSQAKQVSKNLVQNGFGVAHFWCNQKVDGELDVNFVQSESLQADNVLDVSSGRFCLDLTQNAIDLAKLQSLFAQLKSGVEQRLFVRASEQQLTSVLLLASLGDIQVHVSGVQSDSDIAILVLAKKRGMNVTFDVPISFLCGQNDAESAVWQNVEHIDCLSSGDHVNGNGGDCNLISLLMTAVMDGKLSMKSLMQKLYINPAKILSIVPKDDCYVEVEVDRVVQVSDKAVSQQRLVGSVSRVVVNQNAIVIDGRYVDTAPKTGQKLNMVNVSSMSGTGALNAPVDAAPRAVYQSSEEGDLLKHNKQQSPVKSQSQIVTQSQEHLGSRRAREASVTPSEAGKLTKTPFYRQNILSVKQFTRAELHILFNAAHEMRTIVERHGSANILAGKVLCNLFYEPSTRTSVSFETAMIRLGGQVVNVSQQGSSVQKGESLEDTVRTVACYADAVALRHPEIGSCQQAVKVSKVPVINAGDGIGEHPTQAFLDVYTIREELGTVNGLNITVVGDLKNGRTVHSLVKILALYDVKVTYVAPPGLEMPQDLVKELSKAGLQQQQFQELSDDLIARSDVIYVTRVQKERFTDAKEYERVKNAFTITNTTMQKAKAHMILMHPLPRVNEIDPEVDFDSRAAYFRQMKYGLYVRMALLALIIGH